MNLTSLLHKGQKIEFGCDITVTALITEQAGAELGIAQPKLGLGKIKIRTKQIKVSCVDLCFL